MRHELDMAKLKIKQLQELGPQMPLAAIARNPAEIGQCWAVPYSSRCSPIDQPCNSTGSLLRKKHIHEGSSRSFPVVEIETVL